MAEAMTVEEAVRLCRYVASKPIADIFGEKVQLGALRKTLAHLDTLTAENAALRKELQVCQSLHEVAVPQRDRNQRELDEQCATVADTHYYHVVVETGPQATVDTKEEAVAYARQHVYLHPERVPDMLALLPFRVAEWSYGFSSVRIHPVRRRRVEGSGATADTHER